MPNALQITDPTASDNPLAQAPSWADAAQSVAGTVSSGVDALGQWLAAQRAKQQRPPMWSMSNPVGTETTRQPQQLTMPTPGVQDVAFWGGQPVSQQFKDTAQSAIGNALGWVGSAGPGGPIRAFHGSPYDFERFDTSKIGTGEGAQAYGHGLYFAEKEGTATSYRDDLAQKTYQTATGPEPYSNVWSALYHSQVGVHPNIAGPVATNVRNMIDESGSIDKALQQFDMPNDPRYAGAYQQAIDAARRMQLSTNPGKMYEVNIGADPEHFLHWDKPLSEQSPQVQQALAKVHADDPEAWQRMVASNLKGSELYESGGIQPNTQAQALRDAGIPGIRYLDQGSRGAGQGTHNYVVFDANTIDILRKYGLAGLGIGLGGAAAGSQQQPPMAQ